MQVTHFGRLIHLLHSFTIRQVKHSCVVRGIDSETNDVQAYIGKHTITSSASSLPQSGRSSESGLAIYADCSNAIVVATAFAALSNAELHHTVPTDSRGSLTDCRIHAGVAEASSGGSDYDDGSHVLASDQVRSRRLPRSRVSDYNGQRKGNAGPTARYPILSSKEAQSATHPAQQTAVMVLPPYENVEQPESNCGCATWQQRWASSATFGLGWPYGF
ncbi:hypothetical protein CSPX01_10234 [Colletotrichum filicis]|nr:hypothetical protein CSPX01_10234 [Colletotrichum filicis]